MPAKIAAIVNHAGGVAKTTTALNLGYSLAQAARRVLVVDLDPQADLSERLGLVPQPPTLAQVLCGRKGPPHIQHCQWPDAAALDILAADFDDMAGIELALEKQMERERRLVRALAPLRERYDYILLDCPPNLLLLTVNALYAADGVLIPVQAQAKAYRAVDKVLRTVEEVQGYRGGLPMIWGFVLTMREATNAAREVEEALRGTYAAEVFTTVIPRRTEATVDSQYQAPVGVYAPTSTSARAYQALAEEVTVRAR